MKYGVGTFVKLDHLNGEPAHVQKKTIAPAAKKDYEITFEKIGNTLRMVRHIPVSFA